MKNISLFLLAIIISISAIAQRSIPMKNLWAKPEVHVQFQGYTISFTIKDINKALELLAGTGDTSYGITSGLDTAQQYTTELYPGLRMQFQNTLQPLLQNGVGVFLLTAGHAYIENGRHKKVTEVIMDIQPLDPGVDAAYIIFYDPRNHKVLFSGQMAADMYKKDLGIE